MHWGGEGGAPSSCSLSHGLAACLPPTPPAGSRTTQLQGPQALVSRARRQLPGPAWQVSFWEKPQRKGAPLGGREELGKVSSLSGLKFPGGGRPLSTSGALRSHRVSLSPQPPPSAMVPECPWPALLQGLPREGWMTNQGPISFLELKFSLLSMETVPPASQSFMISHLSFRRAGACLSQCHNVFQHKVDTQ